MKFTPFHSFHRCPFQAQVLHVGCRDNDTLISAETTLLLRTEIEETLNLLVHATDGLYFTKLIDGAGHRERLLERNTRQRRQQRKELRGGCAVSFHPAVGLLKNQTGLQGQWQFLTITAGQVTAQNKHALGVDGTSQVHLPFDVHHLPLTHTHACSDSGRMPEGVFRKLHHR